MDYQKIYSDLVAKFSKAKIYQNHPLAPYTTVKIGGPADIFIQTDTDTDFLNVLKYLNGEDNIFFGAQSCKAREHQKKILSSQNITILGNGSNVLISDSGIRGIVIKNNSQTIEILPENRIKVGSGTQLSYLINYTLDHNLIGLEDFAYIPSTLGAAITGNIHGLSHHFTDFIDSVKTFENNPNIILSAILKLTPGDPSEAKKQMMATIQKKSLTQPMNSLGSVFINPNSSRPAGLIIDQELNLKGKQIGDAQVSPLHANFIVNNGHATAKDYYTLAKFVQNEACRRLNIKLEFEIKFLGQF